MMTIEQVRMLIRPNILGLKPYSSARNEYGAQDAILLDANENPFEVWEQENMNRYPDPTQKRAKEKIARIKGIASEQLFLGNGSDEAVDLIIRCFCEPATDSIAIFTPTYGMYAVCAEINNVRVNAFSLNSDFSIDTQYFLSKVSANVKVAFICNPNNPTGNTQKPEIIEQIIAGFKGIVVVDEAYIDFCPEKSVVNLLQSYPNLIVLQTFSKAWALAGARIGIAIANPPVIEILNKVKFPYNIGLPSLKTLDYALERPLAKDIYVHEILRERGRLIAELQEVQCVERIFPSDANFLLVKTTSADTVHKELLRKGIVVRNRSREPLCEGCLRITVGTPLENQELVDAIKAIRI